MACTIRFFLLGSLAVALTASSGCRTGAGGGSLTEPIHLLNGTNLTGFYVDLDGYGPGDNADATFSVTNGMLRISGQHPGYLATERGYADYRLVAEFKWGDVTWAPHEYSARRSGIMVNVTGPDQPQPKGIECELTEGRAGDILVQSGAMLTVNGATKGPGSGRFDRPGREGWKDQLGFRGTNEIENPRGEWNTVEIINTAGNVHVSVNGHLTLAGTGAKPAKGKILLQSRGAELFFRRLDLYPARPKP